MGAAGRRSDTLMLLPAVAVLTAARLPVGRSANDVLMAAEPPSARCVRDSVTR